MNVRFQRDGSLAVLTLDSPPLNLLGAELIADLIAAVGAVEREEGCARSCCAARGRCSARGADVAVFAGKNADELRPLIASLLDLGRRLEELPFPARLLDELEIDTAHVCGHSSGALIALELALCRPDAVQSLVLLEPAPASALVGPQCQSAVPAALGPVMAAVAGGEIASAFDLFLRAVGRQDYRAILDAALGPDGYEHALQESAFFFSDEVPAVTEWTFGADEAARIEQPMLLVEGGETATASTIPPESVRLLAELVPHAETSVLPRASHLMPLEDPGGVARLLAELARRQTSVPLLVRGG